ncbi:MAG TPA: hypothetical protein VHU84_16535 [Lacipirellulaceae bacterium]|nr:hypothetical protein [Lacipirellulaceae bacterium]
MDDPERDKFYSAPNNPAGEGDDDGELELMPLDETLTDRQKKLEPPAPRSSLDIDEIYRDADRERGGEILENWYRNFHYRFRISHVLIGTAVAAIALALITLHIFWTGLIIGVMLAVAALYGYLQWEERKHQAKADLRREAIYARRRAQLAAEKAGHVVGADLPELPEIEPPPDETEEPSAEPAPIEPFRFQLSVRELLILMAIAAVSLGAIRYFGGTTATATILGLVAMCGLVIHALGYEPPQTVVVGWWLILLMYVFVTLLIIR